MGLGSIWHWLVLLLVVVMVFGTKKLKDAGKDLGAAVHGFKEGLKGEEDGVTQIEKRDNAEKQDVEKNKQDDSKDA